MNAVFNIIVILQVVSALTIIGLVLLQHGKGADMGSAFGSGASGSLFGASGSSNFLSKSTGLAAAIFFIATLALVYQGNHRGNAIGGVMDSLPQVSTTAAEIPATLAAPVVPADAAADSASVVAAAAPVPTSSTGSAQSNQIPK